MADISTLRQQAATLQARIGELVAAGDQAGALKAYNQMQSIKAQIANLEAQQTAAAGGTETGTQAVTLSAEAQQAITQRQTALRTWRQELSNATAYYDQVSQAYTSGGVNPSTGRTVTRSELEAAYARKAEATNQVRLLRNEIVRIQTTGQVPTTTAAEPDTRQSFSGAWGTVKLDPILGDTALTQSILDSLWKYTQTWYQRGVEQGTYEAGRDLRKDLIGHFNTVKRSTANMDATGVREYVSSRYTPVASAAQTAQTAQQQEALRLYSSMANQKMADPNYQPPAPTTAVEQEAQQYYNNWLQTEYRPPQQWAGEGQYQQAIADFQARDAQYRQQLEQLRAAADAAFAQYEAARNAGAPNTAELYNAWWAAWQQWSTLNTEWKQFSAQGANQINAMNADRNAYLGQQWGEGEFQADTAAVAAPVTPEGITAEGAAVAAEGAGAGLPGDQAPTGPDLTGLTPAGIATSEVDVTPPAMPGDMEGDEYPDTTGLEPAGPAATETPVVPPETPAVPPGTPGPQVPPQEPVTPAGPTGPAPGYGYPYPMGPIPSQYAQWLPQWWSPEYWVPTATWSPQVEFLEASNRLMPYVSPLDYQKWATYAWTHEPEVFTGYAPENLAAWTPPRMTPQQEYEYERAPRFTASRAEMFGAGTPEQSGLLDIDSPVRQWLNAVTQVGESYAPGGQIVQAPRRTRAQQMQYENILGSAESGTGLLGSPGSYGVDEELAAYWRPWVEAYIQPTQWRQPLSTRLGAPSWRQSAAILRPTTSQSAWGYSNPRWV